MSEKEAQPKVVNVSLTVDALNLILAGLSELPHRVSDSLITGLKKAAEEQLNAPAEQGVAETPA